jgi:catechol 2,3-dioxygenase-like lactoylglutathione lyase family enzyme
MAITVDHIVLWVADPLRSVAFYEGVLGFRGVRVEAFKTGAAPFPSVRVSTDFVIDLMAQAAAPILNSLAGTPNSAGNTIHHLCFAMSKPEFQALRQRLGAEGQPDPATMQQSFGARGIAPEAIYFTDPDGNVLEARYYDD